MDFLDSAWEPVDNSHNKLPCRDYFYMAFGLLNLRSRAKHFVSGLTVCSHIAMKISHDNNLGEALRIIPFMYFVNTLNVCVLSTTV